MSGTLSLLAFGWSTIPGKLALTTGGLFLLIALAFRVGFLAMHAKELRAHLLETLAAAVRRGLPLAPVLRHASHAHPRRHRRGLAKATQALEDGATLGEALEDAGPLIAPHALAAVHAADGTPYLADALAACAREEQARRTVVHRLVLATLYPTLIALIATPLWGTIMQGMVEVVEVMELEGSRALAALDGSRFASDLAFGIVCGVLGTFLIARLTYRAYHGRTRLGRTLRAIRDRLPGVGGVTRLGSGSAVLHATAGLLRAGAPIGDALRRSAPLSGHGALRLATCRAADRLDAGDPADAAWNELPLPASILARAATASAGSGMVLAERLDELAQECESRYRTALERILRLVHPAGLFAVGVVIALHFNGVFVALEHCREVAKPW